jgi:hypothetical protein
VSIAYPDFLGCDSGGGTAPGVPSDLRVGVVPLGTINGTNKTFTTPDDFIHDGLTDERVYLRGQRLLHGASNDYTAVESGGVGTGYDTIVFARAPKPNDNLLLDYYVATP